MPNGHVLATTSYSIRLFDEKFKEIKQIDVSAIGCTINTTKNEIYISNEKSSCIEIYDLNLNKIKTFGSKGSKDYEFKDIGLIYWKNSILYVLDAGNKRIQIFDLETKFIDSIKLDYRPSSISVSDKTIGVCGNLGTYFYDLNTKKLGNEYKGFIGSLSMINSIFYLASYRPDPKTVFCFNQGGEFFIKINVSDKLDNYITHPWNFHILNYKRDIVLFSYNSLANNIFTSVTTI